MNMKPKLCSLYGLVLVGLLLGGCDSVQVLEVPSGIRTVSGETVEMGNGQARAWVKVDRNDRPVAVGVSMTPGAMENLPHDVMEASFVLDLPAVAAMPFDHISLDWNEHGHPPMAIYGLPHFDVHFYMIDGQRRMAIPGGPDTTTVAPQYVAPNYVSTVDAVPMMGVHYVDVTAPEFNGQAFDKTFIFGYTKGEMIFFEPMVTRAFLQTKPNFAAPIPQPQMYQRRGVYYPTVYTVEYDAKADEYTVALKNFIRR